MNHNYKFYGAPQHSWGFSAKVKKIEPEFLLALKYIGSVINVGVVKTPTFFLQK
jgi:hypothetical protein